MLLYRLEDMNLECVNGLAIEFVKDIEYVIDNKTRENNNDQNKKAIFESNPYPVLNIPLSQYIQSNPHATFKIINSNPNDSFSYNNDRYSCSNQSSKFINKVNNALSTNLKFKNKNRTFNTIIEPCSLGSGGVYFIKDESGKKNLAVFKPQDEEPRCSNNPKGFKPIFLNDNEGSPSNFIDNLNDCTKDTSSLYFENHTNINEGSGGRVEGLRRGSISGEGAFKEHAAYLLDHDNFCGIPITSFVELEIDNGNGDRWIKRGSLQEYVEHDYDAEECGISSFSNDQVHKICLADIRYVNTDRNGQNILIKDKELTPIDHGYCFPEVFEDAYFEWMYWPQAKQKFNDEIKEYIMKIDVERDLKKLKVEGIEMSEESNKIYSFATHFLKWATEKGYTAYEMAEIMCMPMAEKEKQPKIAKMYNMAKSMNGGSYTTNDDIIGQISMMSERVSYSVFEEHLSLGRHST